MLTVARGATVEGGIASIHDYLHIGLSCVRMHVHSLLVTLCQYNWNMIIAINLGLGPDNLGGPVFGS